MPITPEDFVIYLCVISEEINLRVSIPQHLKRGLITGTSATVGGFCGGPLGVLVGGAFGGTIAAASCKATIEEVKDIVLKLNREKRLELFQQFNELLEEEFYRSKSYAEFSAKLDRNVDLKHEVIRTFKTLIEQRWKLKVVETRGPVYDKSR